MSKGSVNYYEAGRAGVENSALAMLFYFMDLPADTMDSDPSVAGKITGGIWPMLQEAVGDYMDVLMP